jgi:sulfatase maturation enzyme AslB (radical SAM superfamily)
MNRETLLNKIKDGSIWFCPRLFDHIYTNPNGDYKVCCIGEDADLNTSTTTPKEWLNSKLLTDARIEMLDETIVDTPVLNSQCRRCIEQEANYGESDRQHHVKRLLETIKINQDFSCIDQVLSFDPTQEYTITERCLVLQARVFGNQCNLDCYMCQPGASSTRQLMFKKLDNRKYIKTFDQDSPNNIKSSKSNTIDELVELAPYIHTFLLQGGEPFVMKKQFDFLNRLVESGHSKNIILEMNSNLTVLGTTKYNILDFVDKFRQLNISASLDGFGKYNDYIRRRSDWHTIVSNLNTLRSYRNVKMGVFSTLSLLSVLKYDKLQNFCDRKNLEYFCFVVDDPDELHVRHLPKKLKKKLRKKYRNYPIIVNALAMKGDKKKFIAAINYIKQSDEYYKTDIFKLYPELESYYNDSI